MSTPRPTAVWLVGTLALTGAALAAFLAGRWVSAALCLTFFAVLFATRAAGQLLVLVCAPTWLPPMDEWNFVPYRFLLPAQLALLAAMTALTVAPSSPNPTAGRILVGLSFIYWGAMGLRYAIRMTRVPDARWLGGAIPIVFHCVLAAFVFVLGFSYAV
jgi:hypothetical protein